MKLLKKINGKHTGLFAAGLLLGTAGVKILSSKDAKNVYTKCTAAVHPCKRICYEDGYDGSGKCWWHLCRSTAD